MPRKRKQSPFEDFIELVALFPWWIGLILAVVSYFWLHHIADTLMPVATQPGQIGEVVAQSMYKSLATAGQYIVPLICTLGALFSALSGSIGSVSIDPVVCHDTSVNAPFKKRLPMLR